MTSTINASTTAGIVTTADTSGVLALQTAGTTAVTVDASQNVGIGTATPNSRMSVAVSSTSTSVLGTYANIPLLLQNTSSTDNNWSVIGVQDASGDFSSYIGTQNTSQASSTAIMAFATNGGSGATERMRIDSSGNLAIGTTTNVTLDAVGAARPLVVQKSDTSTTLNGSTAAITIANGSATTNNTAQLNFAAITGASGNQYSSGIISCIFGARTNAQYPTGILTFSTSTSLNTAPSEKMRIDNSGYVLVGRTSTLGTARFVVEADTTTVNPMTVSNTRSTAGADYSILFYRNGSIVGSVQTALGGPTTYATTSDYRLKEDIQPMTGALAKVIQLKPVTYKWKSTGTDGQGFIAHELQEVIPDAVCGEKDAVEADDSIRPQQIDTSFLVATLTAAIQEQQTLITQLQADVAALKGASA